MFIHKFIIMQAIGCHVHSLFITVQVARRICSSKSYNSNGCENNYIFIHPCTLQNGCKFTLFLYFFHLIVARFSHIFDYTYPIVAFVTIIVSYATIVTYDYIDI